MLNTLRQFLITATKEQLSPLGKMLAYGAHTPETADDIVDAVWWHHRNLFSKIYLGIRNKEGDYDAVLVDLLEKLEVSVQPDQSVEILERLLCQRICGIAWDHLSLSDRTKVSTQLDLTAGKLGKSREWKQVGGITGVLVAAELGGFGTYMLATTTLSGISGLGGITLPFTAYTALTSSMGVVLGPVGWVSAALFAIYKLTGTNYAKLIPAALYIAALRGELLLRPNKWVGGMPMPHDYVPKKRIRLL